MAKHGFAESKLHNNYFELKLVVVALMEFRNNYAENMVPVEKGLLCVCYGEFRTGVTGSKCSQAKTQQTEPDLWMFLEAICHCQVIRCTIHTCLEKVSSKHMYENLSHFFGVMGIWCIYHPHCTRPPLPHLLTQLFDRILHEGLESLTSMSWSLICNNQVAMIFETLTTQTEALQSTR